MGPTAGSLLAISDLHVAYEANRRIVDGLRPESDDDWLLVAGDIGEMSHDISWTLETLSARFARVVWAPGNHELWTPRQDPLQLRGVERYRHLVELCRSLGVVTPEDPYPVWPGPDGPVTVAPLFLLYDYTFRTGPDLSREQALADAYDKGVVCTDEFLLHPDPFESRQAWCESRVKVTEGRLAALDPAMPLVLVNHYPLVREPMRVLHHPEFALWCGTERTADWHLRFNVAAMVYGHLHIPRSTVYDGVRFEEVSVGYPREWRTPGFRRTVPPRRILPAGPPPARP
ncbi:metallophosphoesterase [Streptomyces sp. ISL-10]|uniref:metallophosphoesterase family protein n=1 Tax=Streptomyces sp. ISL-10 TaxID=2819172 RepID=UPI001BE7D1FE|nr:metallophosphoesterase [Streptomyces sp. ISL-10]MBT2364002.1 metallophosphoesterase [Streptomyces sp. ISL-10]